MANKEMNVRLKNRRDTLENWETKNPVLLNGETAYVVTNGGVRQKTGDGKTAFKSLPYDDIGIYQAVSALQTSQNGIASDVSALNSAVGAMASDVATAKTNASSALSKIDSKADASTVSALQTSVTGLSSQIATAQAEVDAVEQTVANHATSIAALQKTPPSHTHATASITGLDSTIQGLEGDIADAAATAVTALNTANSKAASDHTHTLSALGAASATHEHAIGDVANLSSTISTITGNLSALEASVSAKANKSDIATTVMQGTATQNNTYWKIADFGNWGTGTWMYKGFTMLITSRAGELVWVSLAANDSATSAGAFRLVNRYSKINSIYYSVSESAIYVVAAAWANNICAHILTNVNGDYVPTVSAASGLPSDAVAINIVEFGIDSTSTVVGDTSSILKLGGSADRPTYNDKELALQNDLSAHSADTNAHMTAAERTNWNAAYSHATVAHAPSGAEVNQNAFSNVKVGAVTIAADSKTDTLTIAAGSNIQLAGDATNDIVTISATDTTYGAATTSANGLMTAAMVTKLNGIATGANAYSLPTASSSTLGGVKTTSTVTSASGYTACPIIGGVPYYKDTDTTYSLGSFGITATATELNYMDGVTSNVQTQLNGKAPTNELSALRARVDSVSSQAAAAHSKANSAYDLVDSKADVNHTHNDLKPFVATYGVTKFSDILAAHNAGQIVMMTSLNTSSYLASSSASVTVVGNVSSNIATFDFAFVDNFGRAVRLTNKVVSNNTWSNLYMATPSLNRTTNLHESDTNYTTLMARGTSLNASDTTPAVNGAIAWTYE